MKFLEARGKSRRGTHGTMALLLALLPAAAAAQSPGELREGAITDRVLDQYRDLLEQEILAFTISQAVDVASELHPEVRLNRERLAEFPSLVREARSPYLPQLDLNLQFARTRDPGFRNSPFFSRLIDDPGASPFGGGDVGDFGGAFTFGTYLWNFQASQVLWSFGLRPALRGVKVERLRVEADLEEVQNRVARDTVARLHSYLLGLRTRDVLRQAVETSERGLALARDRVELGAAARLDIQTSLALADARPEVRANASYGINTFTVENTYDMALHNWNAGVSLTWNFFDGFGSASRVASLRSQGTQNDWERNEYESTLEVTLRNATANWAAALTAIEEATLALEEAAETERVATEELEAGAATPYLVMETAQARRDVEVERTRYTHDALNALAELKYLVGYPANAPHSVIADTVPARAADVSEAGRSMPEFGERTVKVNANLKAPARSRRMRNPAVLRASGRARFLAFAAVPLAAAPLLLAGAGCGREDGFAAEPATGAAAAADTRPIVDAAVIPPGFLADVLEISGRLEPRTEMTVSSELGGAVEAVRFDKRDRVERGALQ